MSEPDPLLDRGAIQEAFRRLGDRLARRGVVADIYVIGGATSPRPGEDDPGRLVRRAVMRRAFLAASY